jgi:hypothetical protein
LLDATHDYAQRRANFVCESRCERRDGCHSVGSRKLDVARSLGASESKPLFEQSNPALPSERRHPEPDDQQAYDEHHQYRSPLGMARPITLGAGRFDDRDAHRTARIRGGAGREACNGRAGTQTDRCS